MTSAMILALAGTMSGPSEAMAAHATPYRLIDAFLGGIVVGCNTIDTDGDGVPDVRPVDNGSGYVPFSLSGVSDSDGDGSPDTVTFPMPQTDDDGDGRPNGSIEFAFTQGLIDTDGDGQGDGPILGGYTPTTDFTAVVWGTNNWDTSSCSSANGIDALGTSGGASWSSSGRGEVCGSAVFDGAWEMTDLTGLYFAAGALDCPAVSSWAINIDTADAPGGVSRLCADQNGDGLVSPADFGAWIINYNSQSTLADVNHSGSVEQGDFSAWIMAYNSGAAGPVCQP